MIESAEARAAAVRVALGEEAIAEVQETPQGPMLSVVPEAWCTVARFCCEDPSFAYAYMRNYAAADGETNIDVVLHLACLHEARDLGLRTSVPRDKPEVPSLVTVFAAANWNEREMYDLLGIHFRGHPDLRRILLPDQWVGYPLRKDYEPWDEGV